MLWGGGEGGRGGREGEGGGNDRSSSYSSRNEFSIDIIISISV